MMIIRASSTIRTTFTTKLMDNAEKNSVIFTVSEEIFAGSKLYGLQKRRQSLESYFTNTVKAL